MTKSMRETGIYYYNLWRKNKGTELCHVYRSPSAKKRASFEEIRREMHKLGGEGLGVLTHSCHIYTCGYKLGNKFVVHTPSRRMEFDIDELFY